MAKSFQKSIRMSGSTPRADLYGGIGLSSSGAEPSIRVWPQSAPWYTASSPKYHCLRRHEAPLAFGARQSAAFTEKLRLEQSERFAPTLAMLNQSCRDRHYQLECVAQLFELSLTATNFLGVELLVGEPGERFDVLRDFRLWVHSHQLFQR